MTQATETDIRELKTAVDGNTRAIEVIGRSTEANTKAVELFDRRLEALTLTTEANAKAIEASAKAIADLTSSVTGLREEVRVGFEGIKGQINTLDTKFDERTKGLGQRLDGKELAQRNIFTGLTVTIVGGILLTLGRFLFFGLSIKP
jgi:prophage DNA circulation protein